MQTDVAERISEIQWPVTIDGHKYLGIEEDGTLIDENHPKAFETRVGLSDNKILAMAHGNPVGPPPDGGG